MPGEIGWEQGAPVHFDDRLFAADLARLPERARAALDVARGRYEREGVPAPERRHCDAEHLSGTRLPGCLKVSAASTNSLITDCMAPGRVGHHDDVT